MKVVLDTNVYVSEALFNALAEEVLTAARQGIFLVYVSQYILDEIADVLRSKFGVGSRLIQLTIQRVSRLAKRVEISGRHLSAVTDVNDHPIAETAINSGADYLVTGDHGLLAIGRIDSVQIVSLRDFFLLLRNSGQI